MTMTRTLTIASAAAAAFALTAPAAHAQKMAPGKPVSDARFAAAAAVGGAAEVQLAELGVKMATDPELKKFSQEMIAAHTKMNSELMSMASQKQVTLPRTIDDRAAFCAESLGGLSGEEFDRCYAKAQLLVHMEAVATFTAEAERGQDSAMKAMAAKALPHIKHHLMTIKPIAMRYEKEEKEEKKEMRERGEK